MYYPRKPDIISDISLHFTAACSQQHEPLTDIVSDMRLVSKFRVSPHSANYNFHPANNDVCEETAINQCTNACAKLRKVPSTIAMRLARRAAGTSSWSSCALADRATVGRSPCSGVSNTLCA
jgi:hypothetical protein